MTYSLMWDERLSEFQTAWLRFVENTAYKRFYDLWCGISVVIFTAWYYLFLTFPGTCLATRAERPSIYEKPFWFVKIISTIMVHIQPYSNNNVRNDIIDLHMNGGIDEISALKFGGQFEWTVAGVSQIHKPTSDRVLEGEYKSHSVSCLHFLVRNANENKS